MENGFGIGSRYSIDGIEVEMEVRTLEERSNTLEIEYSAEKADVVFSRRDNLNMEGMILYSELVGLASSMLISGESAIFSSLMI